MRLIKAILLLALIAAVALCVSAPAENTLLLPAGLEIVGERAFYSSVSLESVTVPEGAQEIRAGAFAYSSLSEITLPSSLTYIADDAFEGCESLTVSAPEGSYAYEWAVNKGYIAPPAETSPEDFTYNILSDTECDITGYTGSDTVLVLPASWTDGNGVTRSVTKIGDHAFQGNAFITAVTIPEGITVIGQFAFSSCTELQTVTLPESLTRLEYNVFGDCSLSSITIPAGVNRINGNVFTNCYSLSSIGVSEDNTAYTSYEGVLYDKAMTTLIACPGAVTELTVPDGVNSIGGNAFMGCSQMLTLNLSASLEEIGYSAFMNCTAMETFNVDAGNAVYASVDGILYDKNITKLIYLPKARTVLRVEDGVKVIGRESCEQCFPLTSVLLPEGLLTIEYSAFMDCLFSEITIPDSVMSIEPYAFVNCQLLQSVTLPGGIGTVSRGMLSYCRNLNSAVLCDGITSIDESAFAYCHNLTSVTIPASVVFISDDAFNGCDSLTIHGYSGSYAETYATEHSIPFEAITDAVTVTIWHTLSSGQSAYLQSCADSFNSAHNGYQVELVSMPYGSDVSSAVLDGTGPDIILNYASAATEYVESGRTANLDAYIYSGSAGIAGFDESLPEGILEGEINGFSDGHIHFLPAYTTGPVLYYNKTLFDGLGLEVPTNWEELEDVCRIIRNEMNLPGVGLDSLTDCIQALIMESGSGYIDVQNSCVAFDTVAVKEQLEWLIDCVNEGLFLTEATMDYFSNDFTEGACAAYIGSSAGYAYIMPEDFEFAIAPMPCDNWYPTWNRGPIVFDYDDSARVQGAYEFVKYFISPEVNFGWVQAVQGLSPYAGTRTLPAYSTYLSGETIAAQSLRAVNANMDKAGALPNVKGAAAVRSNLSSFVKNVVKGANFEEAWSACISACNAALQ